MDNQTEATILRGIISIISSYPGVKRIILFGSRAENHARSDSDFDICVITENGISGEQAYIKMMSTLISSKYSIDLELCDESEYERRVKEGWSFFLAIHERGKELYAA